MEQKLIFTNAVGSALDNLVDGLDAASATIITDTNTFRLVLPLLQADSRTAASARIITIKSDDINKNLDGLKHCLLYTSDAADEIDEG